MADEYTSGVLQGISEKGQDVAEATGVAYRDLGNTEVPSYTGFDSATVASDLATNAPSNSGLSYVDKDKSTVSGQLSSLLSQDSPYIKQAQLAGEKTAAKRGMLNSSISAGASEAQAIQAALPIAQQDAQTYATAQNTQQLSDNQQRATLNEGIVSGGLTKQNATIAGVNQQIQNKFQAAMTGASEQNKVYLQSMQNVNSEFMAQMEADHQLLLQRENTSAAQAEMVSQQASAIMQNYQISVENMMTNSNFLDMGATAVNKALNNIQTLARNSIRFIGGTADVPLDDLVDAYLTDISMMG